MLRRTIAARARDRAAKRAWLAQADAIAGGAPVDRFAADGRPLADSLNRSHQPKLPADHPDYGEKVAAPVMEAVDALPKAYRDCVAEYDFVDVYRAWKRGVSPERIRQMAEANGGRFVL